MNANRVTSKLAVFVLGHTYERKLSFQHFLSEKLVILVSGQQLSNPRTKAFVRFSICFTVFRDESDRRVVEKLLRRELELGGAPIRVTRETKERSHVNVWMVPSSLISPRNNILLRSVSYREVHRCPPDYRRSSRRSITAREAATLDQFRPAGFDALNLRVSTGVLHEARGPNHHCTYPGMRHVSLYACALVYA